MNLGITGDTTMTEVSKLETIEIRGITSVKEIIKDMWAIRDRTSIAVIVVGNT
jgi:hypothetical protein